MGSGVQLVGAVAGAGHCSLRCPLHARSVSPRNESDGAGHTRSVGQRGVGPP